MTTISWTARIIGPDGRTIPATFEAPEDDRAARTLADQLYGKDSVYLFYPTDMARRHRYVRELRRGVDRMMGRMDPSTITVTTIPISTLTHGMESFVDENGGKE